MACFFCFLVGLVFTTGAGEYWLTLFDNYGALGLTLIALIEITATMYVYGAERFTEDIYEMTGHRPGLYWQFTWRFLAPLVLTVILLWSTYLQLTKHPEYPTWNKELVSICLPRATLKGPKSFVVVLVLGVET